MVVCCAREVLLKVGLHSKVFVPRLANLWVVFEVHEKVEIVGFPGKSGSNFKVDLVLKCWFSFLLVCVFFL